MEDRQKSKQLFMEYLQIEKNASPLTVEQYSDEIENLFEFMNREGLDDIKEIDDSVIRIYLSGLYDQNLSRRSVSKRLSCLRSFYRFLERENIVKNNPFLRIHLPKQTHPIPQFFYEEELKKLFTVNDLATSLGQRNQAILEILYATGMRVSECVGLKLSDIDLSLTTVLVRGKGRKERYVPFGDFAKDALIRYLEDGRKVLQKKSGQETEIVFLNARGNGITARGVRNILNKMVDEAALTVNIHPHKLRHTFATHLINEGADLRSVQELLGHEHLASTQIYTHVTKDRLRNVYMSSHPRANKE
ncbi:tyrosine recombinase XerC [Halobacillus sp. Marseille-Q1614]|uniref:tyrosine recombinase XerC n=1 Tax=Halobacillus sp. Marseille-Q1614 TaxID=2709134 RepID=UPI00156DB8EA|nr:tyrosine recombinase XerC [Halobacillus sp. Marseille-Q1614]